ncbi:MAG TPA: L,D-transpeptidase family protein [Jatrophihabitantaceae bacterium]|nr:L,D-transpeptidase family protein [Jatrophihabitantaceae bacterium]
MTIIPGPSVASAGTTPPNPLQPAAQDAQVPVTTPWIEVVQHGQALPLAYPTANSREVITVTAPSTASTTATLQAWTLAPGGGWLPRGGPIPAHVGSDGLSRSPSESRSATPIGSFTLTQAFGHDANPGTGLPYFQTTPADWWISQPGPLYNTHQRCSGSCPFSQGDPNEHLYYETPYYNYAVVIDYNTRDSGPVRQGAGSAFFLHVTDGSPTAGCVAVPSANLVAIMKWLAPSEHPRILIGVA